LSDLLDQFASEGLALVRLDSAEARRLAGLHRAAESFFSLGTDAKMRHSVPNRSTGYRPHAYAHAGVPDKPDLNDSFLYWPQQSKTPPDSDAISGLLTAFEAYRQVAARITAEVVKELAARYDYRAELPFEQASVLQVNSFSEPSDAELLQQPHEDAVFLTVIWTSAKGLEAVRGGELRPLVFAPDEVAVMPGSVMTAMTGGEFEPLFHLARNHGILDRKSIMYFVSPDTTSPIEPFIVNDYNRGTDIQKMILDNPQDYFGLTEDFVETRD
jgi:isopenicillin N synthase-like dioxygenase